MVFQKKATPVTREEEEQSTKVVKVEEVWKVMQVPSAFEPAVVNEASEEVLTQIQATARILNEIEYIKKGLMS